MTLNLSGTTNNLLLQLLILVYFLLLIKQCYYLLCEREKIPLKVISMARIILKEMN